MPHPSISANNIPYLIKFGTSRTRFRRDFRRNYPFPNFSMIYPTPLFHEISKNRPAPKPGPITWNRTYPIEIQHPPSATENHGKHWDSRLLRNQKSPRVITTLRLIMTSSVILCHGKILCEFRGDLSDKYQLSLIRTQGFSTDTKPFCIGAIDLFRFSYPV